ncbi:TetR family transcriptional regulator [Actinorugispora endophytica]|uniref:TetR family transcriptional regulator n=1 Tax=Actinorugispora endophytica TaxID=1605990 RepID=A0A4R6URG4_9ACTN|nr:TetR family transcriptional regulator [Actinorugispora endophytica]TDQ48816.1 TetR family transcriptional regulator [Actinorugispora endophytica]
MSVATAEPRPAPGLRERKKARTRDALVEAGMRLFVERGYAATTTEEIAAHADVSQRTFFRYFAGKEDVALDVHAGFDETFYEAVLARPPHEPLFAVLRNAALDDWARLDRAQLNTRLDLARILECCPRLRAAQLRYCLEQQQRLVEELARRRGTDPETDLRPRLAVAAFFSARQTAHLLWSRGEEHGPDELGAALRRCLDELVPAVTEP